MVDWQIDFNHMFSY